MIRGFAFRPVAISSRHLVGQDRSGRADPFDDSLGQRGFGAISKSWYFTDELPQLMTRTFTLIPSLLAMAKSPYKNTPCRGYFLLPLVKPSAFFSLPQFLGLMPRIPQAP